METRANYALIGAFVLMSVVAVLGFVMWLGSSQFNRDYTEYDIVFQGPVSLEEGASVRYIGVKVGEVETVRIDRRDASKVRARIRVDKTTPVKTDSTAVIDFAGITGVTFVQITAGSEGAGPLLVQPYEDIAVIPAGATPLTALFDGGAEIIGQAGVTLQQASELLTKENISAFGGTLQNLEAITATLAEDDEALLGQVSQTLGSLQSAGDELAAASASANTVMTSVESELVTLNEELRLLVAELHTATGEANTTLSESRKAIQVARDLIDGPTSETMGQTALAAQELRTLLARLDRVVRELEQNPQGLVLGRPLPYEEN
ncbi:MAG: MlaD family protein [Pseudomonadota bacterium]